MNNAPELNPEERSLLAEIDRRSAGALDVVVSMYEAGGQLGMGRQQSARVAEKLLADGLLELRSLSGAVALTPNGREAAAALAPSDDGAPPGLGDGPLLDETRQQAVTDLLADLKRRTGSMGLAFEALSELVADLKTVEVQLTSPRPRTAIVRACFESIHETLQTAGDEAARDAVGKLLAGP